MAKPLSRRAVVAEQSKEDEKDHLSVGSSRSAAESFAHHYVESYFDFVWSAYGWPRPGK